MSYPEMRRKDKLLSREETIEILEKGEYGFLATVGEDGQPYCTPLSYVAVDGFLCIHCAGQGQKLNNIAHEHRVCFAVVGETQPVYAGSFTTAFESAVVFGSARAVEDEAEKQMILRALCEKYLPDDMEHFDEAMQKSLKATNVLKISMDHVTGKAKRYSQRT